MESTVHKVHYVRWQNELITDKNHYTIFKKVASVLHMSRLYCVVISEAI